METQILIEAGILDLGGTGNLILEVEYLDERGKHKETIYRLPNSVNEQDIISATVLHSTDANSIMFLEFNQHPVFQIELVGHCKKLVEVRLPEAVGGNNITHLFST